MRSKHYCQNAPGTSNYVNTLMEKHLFSVNKQIQRHELHVEYYLRKVSTCCPLLWMLNTKQCKVTIIAIQKKPMGVEHYFIGFVDNPNFRAANFLFRFTPQRWSHGVRPEEWRGHWKSRIHGNTLYRKSKTIRPMKQFHRPSWKYPVWLIIGECSPMA